MGLLLKGMGEESNVLENVLVRALLVHPAHYNDYALYKPRTHSLLHSRGAWFQVRDAMAFLPLS